mgnify:CR=1 FL=1
MKNYKATYKKQDSMNIKFVRLKYYKAEFLINNIQIGTIYSSILLKPLAKKYSKLLKTTEYNNNKVLVVNLDKFIKDTFKLTGDIIDLSTCLWVDHKNFSSQNKKLVEDFLNTNKLYQEKFLIKIPSSPQIISISLQNLKLIPLSIREHLFQKGILALNFLEQSTLQFFIDIESIVCYLLIKNIKFTEKLEEYKKSIMGKH